MSDKIQALQLGNKDWNTIYDIPDNVELHYSECYQDFSKLYDIVFVNRTLEHEELLVLHKVTRAHTLYILKNVEMNSDMMYYAACKKAKYILESDVQDFLSKEIKNYYSKPYGEKYRFKNFSIAQGFDGKIIWDGNYCVSLNGNYGDELNQIAFWRNNVPIFKGQAIEFWLEYEKDPEVEIALSITHFLQGSLSTVQQTWVFREKELKDMVTIDNQMENGPIFVSILARGKGNLKIIALHDRYSRRGHGAFLPGGERYVASNREEIFAYFDPADMKPPLAVYFSGYKTMEGFEGYYLMRRMGCPFLLIGEPRLEGGAFYMGTPEYEQLMVDVIKKYMNELGFTNNQVILSGLSMGTYGALYYGCDILPHAMILGKPLASIGDVAFNEKLHRPGGFATSLDVLRFAGGSVDKNGVKRLNDRFWNKFDKVNWSNSKFIVSYMIEDDYDMTAYDTLISHVHDEGVQVYGKGIHGRHNDNSSAINRWFISQYKKILKDDFMRGKDT